MDNPVAQSHPLHSDPLGFLARLLMCLLIAILILTPYAKLVDPSGATLAEILKYSAFGWAFFITIEVLESAQRDFTAVWGWVIDNLLSVAGFVVGALVLTGPLRLHALTSDENHFVAEAMVWISVDLVTGLLIPIIIAGSIKFRREEEH